MITVWAVFGWALAGALFLALWAHGNTKLPYPRGIAALFRFRQNSLWLWVALPVVLWGLVFVIFAGWLSLGDDGFKLWERAAWLSGSASSTKSAAETRVEEIRNLLGAMAVVIGSFAGALTIGLVWRRSAQQEEQIVTDRNRLSIESLAKSGEALGSDKMATRLSAVFALEAIALYDNSSDKRYLKQAMELLAAFIRHRSQERYIGTRIPDESEELEVVFPPSGTILLQEEPGQLDADLQAAVTVLVRSFPFQHRPSLSDRGGVDLRMVRLPRLQLSDGSDLRNFNFDGADLRYCHALSANCQGAEFSRVNANHSNFAGTNFTASRFFGASFIGASFSDRWRPEVGSTIFRSAELIFTRLSGATARNCDFIDATFHACEISGADFSGASFEPSRQLPKRVSWETPRPPIWPQGFVGWVNEPMGHVGLEDE